VKTAEQPAPLKSSETEAERRLSFIRHEVNNVLAVLNSNFNYVKKEMGERGLDLGEDGRGAFEDMGNAIIRLGKTVQMDPSELDQKISQFKKGASENGKTLEEGAIESFRQKTVFVIDDEFPLAKSLERIVLGAYGNGKKPEVMVFSSALQAKEAIEAGQHPDFTICDIMMPGMTGAAYYGWLKQVRPELIDKILFLCGYTFGDADTDPYIQEIHEKEILLTKPFDTEEVQSRVKKALGGKSES